MKGFWRVFWPLWLVLFVQAAYSYYLGSHSGDVAYAEIYGLASAAFAAAAWGISELVRIRKALEAKVAAPDDAAVQRP